MLLPFLLLCDLHGISAIHAVASKIMQAQRPSLLCMSHGMLPNLKAIANSVCHVGLASAPSSMQEGNATSSQDTKPLALGATAPGQTVSVTPSSLPVPNLMASSSSGALPVINTLAASGAASAASVGSASDPLSMFASLSNLLSPQQLRSFLQSLQASGQSQTQAQVRPSAFCP